MVRNAQLGFALCDGVFTSISNVERGLACGCVCPACGANVVAKKGPKKEHHFAHSTGSDCPNGQQTAIHLAAKQILARSGHIVLPEVVVEFNGGALPIQLAPEQSYRIESIMVERVIDTFVPDVVVHIQGRAVAVEIYVTHKVGNEKLAKFRRAGMSAVEVDLSKVPRVLTLETLEPLVVGGGKHKAWLFNAAAERKHEAVVAQAQILPTVRRGFALHVDGCPVSARVWRGNSYANVLDDCTNCEHAVKFGGTANISSVFCAGFQNS